MTDGFPYADPKTPGNFAAATETTMLIERGTAGNGEVLSPLTRLASLPSQEPERDEAKEQRISDLIEKIANLPGITPEDLELLEEITGNGKPGE